jgi:hypothetical protein
VKYEHTNIADVSAARDNANNANLLSVRLRLALGVLHIENVEFKRV